MIYETSKQYVNACIKHDIDKISDNHLHVQCMLKIMPFLIDRYLIPKQKEIFTRLANGEKQVTLAEEFNCTQPTICRINKYAIDVLRDKYIVVIETMKQYQFLLEDNNDL